MPKASRRPAVVMPSKAENAKIAAAAKADPDAQPLTPKQLKAMVPLRALGGRPKSGNAKQLVSIRYNSEVLAFFKSTGEDWRTRMDVVLRQYVSRRLRQA